MAPVLALALALALSNLNPCTLRVSFCAKISQCFRYVYSCLQLTILLKVSTNKPSHKPVVFDSSAKPSQWCVIGILGLAENSRTTDLGHNFAYGAEG